MTSKQKRMIAMLLGNFIIALGISFGVIANLGIDPGMTFFYGMSHITKQSLSMITPIFNILFLLPLLLFDRSKIGLATIVNMVCIGIIVEFFTLYVFQGNIIVNTYMRYGMLMVGIVLQSFGVALYSSAHMGQSPLDGIPNVLVKALKKGNYRTYRVLQDCFLVIVGVLCGAHIGIGTLLLVLLVGPCIHFFQSQLNQREIQGRTSCVE